MATAHSRTAASSIVAEAQDMLRISNLDRRVLDWIGIAMTEIINRLRTSLFYEVDGPLTCGANSRSVAVSSENSLGSPVLAVFVDDSTNKVYTPRYLEPNDFDRLEKDIGGGSYQTADFPLYWTLDDVAAASETLGKGSLRYFPQINNGHKAWVWFMGQYMSDSPAGTDKVWLPYHWEHVLVWKICALGARFKKPQLHALFEAEFELAMQQMITIMNYRPDQIPVLQELTGPMDETPQGQGMPQFPSQVNQ